jgi:ABC-2 type transport system permease protein
LYKKDLRSFFTQPTFYLVAGVCAAFWAPLFILAFTQYLGQMASVLGSDGQFITFHERVVLDFVSLTNFTILLVTNGVTMKLLAEEKRNHTFELLMTSPIRSWHIVAAKYLTGLTVVGALLFVSLVFPLTAGLLGKVQWTMMFCAYLGLFIFSAVYVAMGLLGSALVSSVIMAFMISLVLNLSLMFLGVGGELASSGTMVRFFNYINWEPILKEFSSGVIRTTSLLYLGSIIVVALFCAERLTESSRWK